MTGRPIVVGVDGSKGSFAAAEQAAALAHARGVPLRLVHGYLHPLGYGRAPIEPYPAFPPPPPPHGEAMLNELANGLRTTHPGLVVEHRQMLGGGGATLVAESHHSPLLVVGCRGHGAVTGLLLGSVSAHVVAHAHCPVLVVRPSAASPTDLTAPVVVGVDGSTNSDRAVAFAAAEARLRGRRLLVVHTATRAEPALREATRLLDRAVQAAQDAEPALSVTGQLRHDPQPQTSLVEESKGAAVLVVGSRGRGGFTGLLLGSVSQAVVHHAQCPVLVVPPAQPQSDGG